MSSCNPSQTQWNAWLAQNAARFLMFAKQQTRCTHDAEDVLQESLVEAWKRTGGEPQAALVFATIRRRAIDLGRRTDRRLQREQSAAEEPDFHSTLADDEEAPRLEEAMKHLPAPQREVLILKFWGGLTFADVAATLEIPTGTAASRYRLALETLRETLTLPLSS